MNTPSQAYIFIGRSGCGKGTQAGLLMKRLAAQPSPRHFLHMETGKLFRDFKERQSFTGLKTREIVDSGGLMPAFMPIYLWGSFFVENYTGVEDVVMDGTPRKLLEAQLLDSLFPFYGMDKPWIIYLDVDHEESAKRLSKRGRTDDSVEGIARRMAWYESDVYPSIEFYRTNPNVKFLSINGHQPIDAVHEEIVKNTGLV